MKLSPPFSISSRLMAGLKIGTGTVSVGYSDRRPDNGRIRYEFFIDAPDVEFSSHSLQEGKNVKGGLQKAFVDLLSFLSAAASDYRSNNRLVDPEGNSGLFPENVVVWAWGNEEEITDLIAEIQGEDGLIQE